VTANGSTIGSYLLLGTALTRLSVKASMPDMSDARLNFAGSLLHSGQNTITIKMNQGGYFANHVMYD